MSARFGDILQGRRREMGLSIQQVANTIKIRPQIIEYFELGNFASMPPRGYAQGMISSYARFLGLNPTEIVNIYFDELCAYENGGERKGGDFQAPAGPVSSRSSNEAGRFYMVGAGPRNSRYGQRAMQAGYVTETGSSREIRAQRDRVRRTLPPAESSVPTAQGLVRNPRAGYGDGQYSGRGRGSGRPARLAERGQGRSSSREGAGSRGRAQHDGRRAYGAAPAGRSERQVRAQRDNRSMRSSRNGRPVSGRNDVRSRRDAGLGPARRGAAQGRRSSSALSSFDPKFLIAAGAIVLAILVLLVFLVSRSCSSSAASTTLAEQSAKADAAASKTSSSSSKSSKKSASKKSLKSDSDAESDDADSDSDTSTDEETGDAESTDTDSTDFSDGSAADEGTKASGISVKVKLASKKTAFIEVRVDGKLVYGEQATGPLTKEYTASESVEITTSKPSYVTITKNGKKVRYDSQTSGVARVTLTVPTSVSSSSSDSSATDASSSSEQDATGAGSTSTGTSSSGTTATTTSAASYGTASTSSSYSTASSSNSSGSYSGTSA